MILNYSVSDAVTNTKIMNRKLIFIVIALSVAPAFLVAQTGSFDNGLIRYSPVLLGEQDKQILRDWLDKMHPLYSPEGKMITKQLNGYNYHTDAETGRFHEVRASFNYAVGLLDSGDERYTRQALEIIEKTISLQDTNSASRYSGVWPYYEEEPLATKKSPVDFNWADFNAVALLDVYMGHQSRLSEQLKNTIRRSLIYAARSVQKRNVGPGYTNIAIMGTYVTYMVSHLFDIPDMKEYAQNRLQNFYEYTLLRGFTEYNSPTYTIVALDELDRMKRHIIAPAVRPMIDSLYSIGWEVIAKHYHRPTGQWAGPHSRSYRTLMTPSIYGILQQASNGKIALPGATQRHDVKIKHEIPAHLLTYFVAPRYPRVQRDVLAIDEPEIIGTTYLAPRYAFSSANRSSLWNQRRPFLVYWGSPDAPRYLQLRFLHDEYDFSSASFYSRQEENKLIGAVGFLTNGGDKHISIDRIKEGKFKAKDLRLRFEFGNSSLPENLKIPKKENDELTIKLDGLHFAIQLYASSFGELKGHWEKGGDGTNSWLDYVVYSGNERDFDLSAIDSAVLGFTFSVGVSDEKMAVPQKKISGDTMEADWKGLRLTAPAKPIAQPRNL